MESSLYDFLEHKEEIINELFEYSFQGHVQELELIFKNLGSYFVQVTPVMDDNNDVSHLNLVFDQNETYTSTKDGKVLRAIIDNIPDYIFVKDLNHKSILANSKFKENILGQMNNELAIGYTPLDYYDQKTGETIIRDNERVMKSGVPVINRPDVVVNKEGKEERVLLTKVPLKDEKDQITGLVGIARDITENYLYSKRLDLTLKIIQSLSDKPSLDEAMKLTIELISKDLKFDYAEAYKISSNKYSLKRTASWPVKGDSISLKLEEGLPGQAWKEKTVQIATRKENPEVFEVSKSLSELNILIAVPIIFGNEIISILQFGSRDKEKPVNIEGLEEIGIQIASAIESKRSRDQLNDFFRYSMNLVAVIGLDGFTKMINPAFEHKFGYSQEEILSKAFTEFIHPEDLPEVLKYIEDVDVPGAKIEIRCRKKDGSYLWISWRLSKFIEGENIVYVFGTDITPLKEAYEELSNQIIERKKIQSELQLSEKKYRSLFELSPLPMWVLDREKLGFLDVNRAAVKLYGYSREEFLSMTVRDLWAPNQEERINTIVSNNYNDFFKLKVKHKTRNGDFLFVSVKSNPLEFDGVPARVSLINDITDLVKAERKLMDREKRFKALVQEGSDLISILDENHNYIYNSPASDYVFGLKPEELKGVNFRKFISEKDIDTVNESFAQLNKKKRVQLPSYRIKNTKNEWRWLETIATDLSDDPAVGGVVLNSRDITEFIQQERKLKESLHRYDVVAKATSDIITDYDIAKDEVTFNDATTKVLGYPLEEIGRTGAWWDDKIHPEDFVKIKSEAGRMKDDKVKNLTTEYRFRCADGKYKFFLDRSYLLTDDHGNPKRIIGSMQDITERKNYLMAIEDHNKRLKDIAWTQSHVVRAPLAKIMGLVDLLSNYREDIEDTDELIDNILIAAGDLDKIIRKIAVETEKEL